MTAETLDSFRTNAEHHHATVHETAPEDVRSIVSSLVDPPAVGVAPGYDLPAGIETDPTPAELAAANTGVTAASLAIADYGTLVLEDDAVGSEPASLFPERHVALLRAEDIVPSIADALATLGPRLRDGTSVVLATGPSATADMGALVLGAHGPEEVHVVLVGGDGTDGRHPGGTGTGSADASEPGADR